MNAAIVHEWLNNYGGSERLLSEILEVVPSASLYALIHNDKNLKGTPLEQIEVVTSLLQKVPRVESLYRWLLPLMPFAVERLNLHPHDLIISISHAVAHGIKKDASQLHISYVCTPMRYAWHLREDYLRLHRLDKPGLSIIARLVLDLLRRWDAAASSRADRLLSISEWTRELIRRAWRRESTVIYPPVEVERFNPARDRDNFYMTVSRFVPYKMVAEIIRAFNHLRLPLIVVGDGPEYERLLRSAGPNVQLVGYQNDSIVTDLMNRAKGFVYMAVEDFGIAMAEAQAAGCPVIAHARGGATEIVREGETGYLFSEQTPASMIEAVLRLEQGPLNNKAARKNAIRFSSERFRREFTSYLDAAVTSFRSSA